LFTEDETNRLFISKKKKNKSQRWLSLDKQDQCPFQLWLSGLINDRCGLVNRWDRIDHVFLKAFFTSRQEFRSKIFVFTKWLLEVNLMFENMLLCTVHVVKAMVRQTVLFERFVNQRCFDWRSCVNDVSRLNDVWTRFTILHILHFWMM
jgi:hypothetical protein